METITISKNEYLDLINLYHIITEKIERIKQFDIIDIPTKNINTFKYCGAISMEENALTIQKQMRTDWE